MRTSDSYNNNKNSRTSKTELIVTLLKVFAVILVVLSIVLIIYGLIPHERVSYSNIEIQGGCLGCSYSIGARKGDILIVEYEIDGSDTAFYLTYSEPWDSGDQDPIIQRDHTRKARFEIDVKNSGLYYLNFKSNDPSSTATFDVNLDYKVMSRYSPLHIYLGVTSLVIGFILAILRAWLKKRPKILEDEYIRLMVFKI